jgi:hypothetical protein
MALASGLAGAQTLVDTCGQVLSGAGHLAADLDCSASAGAAVTIDGGGALDLAGFTITAGPDFGVKCETGSCEVFSEPPGGQIVGGFMAFWGPERATGTIRNVVVRDAVHTCARAGKLRIFDTQVQNGFICAISNESVYMERATITGCSIAVIASSPDVGSAKATIVDSLISGNETGVDDVEARILIMGSEISGNAVGGVRGRSVEMENTAVVDNGVYGVLGARRIVVTGGEISGNGAAAGPDPPFDGAAFARHVVVKGASITGNTIVGISSTRSAKVSESTIAGNTRDGIVAAKVVVDASSVTGNGGHGLRSYNGATKAKLSIRDSVISGNGLFGAIGTGSYSNVEDCTGAGSVTVRDSELTGNGLDPDCGVTEACGSLASCTAPRLLTSTCDTSYVVGSGLPGDTWGVCALD